MENTILINFPDISPAEGSLLAMELRDYIGRNTSITPEIIKSSNDTMDFGATISIILGASSTIALAKALGNWVQLHQRKKINIKSANGEISGENLSSKDVQRILEKINL